MKSLLLLPLWATSAYSEQLAQADLTKLKDPAKAHAEVARLVLGKDSDPKNLKGYHFLKAEQPNGKPPLYVLSGEDNFTSNYRGLDAYEIDKPEEIFGDQHRKVFARLEPSLDFIEDSVLFVFDHKGKEIRPFGGNNFIDGGHLYDFDGDGILDRADTTNYGLDEAPKHDIKMFELHSVELKPREILRVIYDWHPDSANEANEWTYRCTDTDADGRPEIRFGPKDSAVGENPEPFVLRWDPASGKFSAGEIPKGSHIRVLKKGESLESVAKAGGLGYPLVGKSDDDDDTPAVKSTQRPYEFFSFTDRSDKELAAFFQSKDRRDVFDGAEGSFPNVIPDDLFALEPKKAALALAEANRTATHRNKFQLAIDDRNGIAPSASGWALYDWMSSGCYSLSTELYAIRYGGMDPVLLNFGYNSIGAVGRNPWADRPAHNARIVKLSDKEATFLAHTLFWLDRVRSKNWRRDDNTAISGDFSSADGHASVTLFPTDGSAKELTSATAWATTSISGKWTEEYDREVYANLAGLLIRAGVPKMLQDRWEKNQPNYHNLRTPTEERLRDRLGEENRKKLEADIATVLAMDSASPLPPEVIAEIAGAAGEESLVSLLPALQEKLTALPAKTAEEKELAALEKRFLREHSVDPFTDKPQEYQVAYKRLNELREKLTHNRSNILREPLTNATEKLRLASDSKLLRKAVLEKSPHARWALSILRRTDPETWAILIAADFSRAEPKEKPTILSTLIAGHPPSAAKLISLFTNKQRRELIPEVAAYHKQHAPEQIDADIPLILALLADRKNDIYRRIEAMDLLTQLPLTAPQQEEFTKLLLAEMKSPQKGEYTSTTLGSALLALATLPNPEKHLEFILSLSQIPKNHFEEGFHLIEVMTRTSPQREKILSDFVRTQFVSSYGNMNQVFLTALTYDLRPLAAEIAAFATEKPTVEDGDGANYSGGNFKTPVGQRYHIAREITALWSEKNPQTLARQWIALIASRPYQFLSDRNPPTLRTLAAQHINTIPPEQRKIQIQSILREIPIEDYYAETRAWLESLTL